MDENKMCKRCEDKQACVPFFEHENAMMHMQMANRNMMIVAIVFALALVAAIVIFVNGYTSRTKDWLTTLANLQNRPAVTEVADGVHQQSNP